MKTITKTYELFSFDELSEEAKKKALNDHCDINVDWEWWRVIYEDAENVKLKITGFDIGRGRCCNMDFIGLPLATAEAILENHGEVCETYKYAKAYKNFCNEIIEKADTLDPEEHADIMERSSEDFLSDLAYCYLKMLREEYEYQTSDEGIRDAFEANEYTFLEDGTMFNE